MLKDPAIVACEAIVSTLKIGSAKDGCDDSWRKKSRRYHLAKATRHAFTACMTEVGILEHDGEDHIKLAITRLAMALSIEV